MKLLPSKEISGDISIETYYDVLLWLMRTGQRHRLFIDHTEGLREAFGREQKSCKEGPLQNIWCFEHENIPFILYSGKRGTRITVIPPEGQSPLDKSTTDIQNTIISFVVALYEKLSIHLLPPQQQTNEVVNYLAGPGF